jgi:hypothetical protein
MQLAELAGSKLTLAGLRADTHYLKKNKNYEASPTRV